MFAVKHGGYTLTYLVGYSAEQALEAAKTMYPSLNVRVEETTPEKEGIDAKAFRRGIKALLEGKIPPRPGEF